MSERSTALFVDGLSIVRSTTRTAATTAGPRTAGGPRVSVPVVQRFNGAAYQHLYQKGFRAGRRYERERYEWKLEESRGFVAHKTSQVTELLRVNRIRDRELCDMAQRLRLRTILIMGAIIGDLLVAYMIGRGF